jgi:acetyl-CoA acetyltransferase
MSAPVYVVDGTRTPFLKARNRPGPFAASDLAVQAGRALLSRLPFAPEQLDEVILGCASPSPDEVNIGRVVALRIGCGLKVPGWTVMRNCASGMHAPAARAWCSPAASTRCRARRCCTRRKWCCGSPRSARRGRSDRKPARS